MLPTEREACADAILHLIDLAEFSSPLPRELSGGMRQHIGIARVMVTKPDALQMD